MAVANEYVIYGISCLSGTDVSEKAGMPKPLKNL
nr:MAG TPA: hypothetical protein [Caudoviricetes sp.]